MTATLDDVTSRKKKAGPTAEQRAAQEMCARPGRRGLSLTGPMGPADCLAAS